MQQQQQQQPTQPPNAFAEIPQLPSMLNNQQYHGFQPIEQPVQPFPPSSINQPRTPVSAKPARPAPTSRKTLTDNARKRMCQYAKDHPHAKQTEIGAIFGLERSTVSKVLRQKEKYLTQNDGSEPPVKRAKGRSPDIERALAVSAKNLMGARSRKSSLASEDAEGTSTCHTFGAASSSSSPRALGPPSPVDLDSARSQDSSKHESPDNYSDYTASHGPFHSRSETSLNSTFTDTAPSSSSPGPLSSTSPFFTPDSDTGEAPFGVMPLQTPRRIFPATGNGNSQRPRSQTVPQLDHYMIAPAPTEAATQKHSSEALDSPMEEGSEATTGIRDTLQACDIPQHYNFAEDKATFATPEMMGPPPLPAHVLTPGSSRYLTSPVHGLSIPITTTPEEALRALEVAHSFFQQQPSGFLEYDESLTMGKLMERLTLHCQLRSISG
ncbi:hypothetical protein KC330_g9114 [Hortaea werneckii]|nr:hypothetical protein KC330_g9114 [Hortaea werneckii]